MKRSIRVLVVATCLITPRGGYAACEDVIRLSKVTSETIQNSSQVESYARTFCSEYFSSSGGSSSTSFGVAYNFLSASLGNSSASFATVASKYCDAVNQGSTKADAYRQYVETIAPGAYPAYVRCKELEGSGLTFSVDPNTVLPTYFAVVVSFQSADALASQIIDHTASPDVQCAWKSGTGSRTRLAANTGDALTCKRTLSTARSAVNVVAVSRPNSQLAFAWDRFDGEVPVNTVKELRQEIARFNEGIRTAVVAFDLPTCPDGWVEYKPAYGRFIRGIDKSGANVDPDGERPAGSLQGDLFAQHSHSRPRDVYDAGTVINNPGAVNQGTALGYGYQGLPETGTAGGPETRPKNVALLYCTPIR